MPQLLGCLFGKTSYHIRQTRSNCLSATGHNLSRAGTDRPIDGGHPATPRPKLYSTGDVVPMLTLPGSTERTVLNWHFNYILSRPY